MAGKEVDAKYLSHEELDDLVMRSEYNLIKRNVLEWSKKKESDKSNYIFDELDKRFEEIIEIEDRDQRNAEYVEFLNEFFKEVNHQTINQLDESTFINKIGDCSKAIKEYLLSWGKVCRRIDKITVRKDYFKILARKTFFKYESKVGKKRTPLPSEVKLSGQKGNNYFDEPINEGISQFWQNRVAKALNLHSQLESMLFDYKKAIETEKHNQENPKGDNGSFDKLHLVDFRKMFLSVCSLVMDSLRPIVNELIIVSDNVSKDEDKYILDFVNDKKTQWDLFQQIENLQTICKDNGENIFFGKATFNKYTSEQAPNHRNNDIAKVLRELKIEKFVSDYIDLDQEAINRKIYQSTQSRLENLNNPQISPIIRAQYFKYKPIPTLVRFGLAKELAKQQGKKYSDRLKGIQELFRIFGSSKSPALDYKNNRTDFSLDNYPIKVAFDYAWEMCARSEYAQKPVDFPKSICEKFLEKFFECKSNEKYQQSFVTYARLLKINEDLATLEHFENEPPKDIESIYQDAQRYLDEVGNLCSNEDRAAIAKWYEEYNKLWTKGDHKKLKEWIVSKSSIITNFTQAKMHLGQKRGSQKTFVLKSYFHSSYGKIRDNNRFVNSNVTEVFKTIASTFGKSFATIREYFNEESEVNKIEYGAVIIKDKNGDKYLLLQKKNEGGIDMPIFNKSDENGDCDLYQVKSLTSKTVRKIIASPNKYNDFFVNNDGKKIIYPDKTDFKYKINPYDKEEVKKRKRELYNNDLVRPIIYSLTQSKFANKQNFEKYFDWTKALKQCSNIEQLYKTIDQKGYSLNPSKISKEQIADLVNNMNCYLLPIVNQNITAKTKNDTNQFTKDWNKIFNEVDKDYRIHPEFTMFYRYPTPDYPKFGEKRYSRFQMNVNFLMEVIPADGEYCSRKEQIEIYNAPKDNENCQKNVVERFNNKIKALKPSYFIGIDRGINELATLCVIDKEGKIVGDFEIYKREFDSNLKRQKYTSIETRDILDLSYLRVEKDENGESRLVDLSESEVWIDSLDHDKGKRANKQIVHLKHLYYLRCIAHLLQSSDYKSIVLEKLKDCNNLKDEEIKKVFEKDKFVDSYKGGEAYTDLPYDEIRKLISDYQEIEQSNQTESEKSKALNTLCQLDASEYLKKGVVANMIGVVVYVLKKYNYDAYISLENLCYAYGYSKDTLSGYSITSTKEDPYLDFKDQENAKLAGLGTYSFFEVQLLKKLFKLQIEENTELIPAFRSVDNYEKIFLLKNIDNKIYQFGIVYFVDPKYTSLCCPICGEHGKKNVDRKKHTKKYDEDELVCKQCGFHTNLSHIETRVMEDKTIKNSYDECNLKAIVSGDANAAYNIAIRLGKNIYSTIADKVKDLHHEGKKYIIVKG
ncbi:MAG: hypothetical protein IKP73_15965 [Bacteroidales bacterium]|nr:hypothetical protein [Bacteroidales bacterium]